MTERTSLALLRRRIREVCDRGDLGALAEQEDQLRNDPRAGARELVLRCERFRAGVLAERSRIDQLFELRRSVEAEGATSVAGVDEVGVGPLAGPVVAAAVVLPARVDLPGLDDSKKVPRKRRESLAGKIREQARGWAIGEVAPAEIDRINILQASLEAMRRAVAGLAPGCRPDHVLVDARRIPGIDMPQTAVVHGDSRDASIAAASILAKVYRDALMQDLENQHPGYGLGQHMGYPTSDHIQALRERGPSPVHRRSFRPVANSIRS